MDLYTLNYTCKHFKTQRQRVYKALVGNTFLNLIDFFF